MRLATDRPVGQIVAVNGSKTRPVGVHVLFMVSLITNIFHAKNFMKFYITTYHSARKPKK